MSSGGTGPDDERAAWRARRAADAAQQAAALARREAAESRQARELVRDFVTRAQQRSLPVTVLRARGHSGRATYRSNVSGWYLRHNHSLGVGADGELYVLNVPDSLVGRWRGVRLTPTDPPLVVGRGGRDGESWPLADLLRSRLEAGAEWE